MKKRGFVQIAAIIALIIIPLFAGTVYVQDKFLNKTMETGPITSVPINGDVILNKFGDPIPNKKRPASPPPNKAAPSTSPVTIPQQVTQPAQIDYSHVLSTIKATPMLAEIPEKGKIGVRFYNFNTGVRAWEKSYVMETSNAYEGPVENTDLYVIIHSKYVPDLKTQDLCTVINNAKINGDLGVETEQSTTALLWKFRGLMDYRDCLGL